MGRSPRETLRGPMVLAVVIACGLAACGDDDAAVDGGATDASVDARTGVTPPDIPWLDEGVPPIAIAPCPDGWREVDDGSGVATCDPYPEGGALECPAGQAHFPGEPGCAPVGSPCPTGDFSEALPADRNVVYVQPGASGDGSSPASPYGSVTAFSIGGLPTGTVVALSRGTHVGPVRLTRGVALWGACTADTVLMTDVPSESEGVATLTRAAGELHDLTVADSPRVGVWLQGDGADGVLEGVIVDGVEFAGVYAVNGARLTVRAAIVRGTLARARDGLFGRGLGVELGATAEVTRAIFDQNRDVGIFANEAGTALTLADVVVRGTREDGSRGNGGRGFNVVFGAMAELTRVLFEGNREFGVSAGEPGTVMTLANVVVRSTRGRQNDGLGGGGLSVQRGATASVTQALFDENRAVGVLAIEPDAAVTLADVVVRGTQGQEGDGTRGRGLSADSGARADVTRVLFDNNHEACVTGSGASTAVTLVDVAVRGTQGQESDGGLGRGLDVQFGATADVTRALFDNNRDVAVSASSPSTSVTLVDVVARDTEADQIRGLFGRGLAVQRGARGEVTRAFFDNNREVGVFASAPDTALTLADVVVQGTRARACAETDCPATPAGHGIGTYHQASLSMTRFVIARSSLCGAQIADDGQMDLADGEVRGQPIGVCLQVGGYDVERLTSGVVFADNEVNLQSTELPIPNAAEMIPEGP